MIIHSEGLEKKENPEKNWLRDNMARTVRKYYGLTGKWLVMNSISRMPMPSPSPDQTHLIKEEKRRRRDVWSM